MGWGGGCNGQSQSSLGTHVLIPVSLNSPWTHHPHCCAVQVLFALLNWAANSLTHSLWHEQDPNTGIGFPARRQAGAGQRQGDGWWSSWYNKVLYLPIHILFIPCGLVKYTRTTTLEFFPARSCLLNSYCSWSQDLPKDFRSWGAAAHHLLACTATMWNV